MLPEMGHRHLGGCSLTLHAPCYGHYRLFPLSTKDAEPQREQVTSLRPHSSLVGRLAFQVRWTCGQSPNS